MKFIVSTILLFVVWLGFTVSLDPEELITGLTVAIIVSLISKNSIAGENPSKWFSPKRWLYAIAYIPYFLKELTMANLDVAYRVISPKLPINPGIVTVKPKLKPPMARLVLANSITLTPGTITVDIHEDEYYIHWINVTDTDIKKTTEDIVAGFEKYLEVIFE